MLCIRNDSTDPYFNLALEDYLLNNFSQECFMLWQDEPSIIVGKNQNSLSEINIDYVQKHNIPVVRRLSGGGAVFHDLGNLNFTFITNDNSDSFANFEKFTLPIIEVLRDLSVKAEFSGRNDLLIDGKKFSGNAQYKCSNRLLHHGTLLFTSKISDLAAALNVDASKFDGKGIKSVESRVTNITEHLKRPITILDFKKKILEHIQRSHKEFEYYELIGEDIEKVKTLVSRKYSTWEWNYGSSPAYNFKNCRKFSGGFIEAYLIIKNGLITQIKLQGDFFSKNNVADIERLLTGIKHEESALKEALIDIDIDCYFSNITRADLVSTLLG
jgi:lipoate---protein ligase